MLQFLNIRRQGAGSRPGVRAAVMARIFRGRGPMALADQVLISGSNFLTTIALVRGLGLPEFGKYTIAYALLLYANALQMSFIASPMLSLAPLMEGEEKRRFVQGMFSIQLAASLLLCVVFALAGAVSRIFTNFYSVPCIVALSLCVGTFQLQDWLRRYYFLRNKAGLAIASDAISYFAQLVIVVVLWRTGRLSLTRTFAVVAATSAAGFALGFVTDRLRPAFAHVKETWGRCKVLSRDLLIANQVGWFSTQGVLLIGTGIVGTTAAGGLRATQSLAGPVNLAVTSLDNVFPIRVAEELKSRGAAEAHRYVTRKIVGCALIFAPLIALIAVFGRPILRMLYGPAMTAFYLPMLLQLACVIFQIAGKLWYHLYRGLQESRAILRGNALSALASLVTVYLFGHFWGAAGIVLSSIAGQIAITSYCAVHWQLHRGELLRRYPAGGPLSTLPVVRTPQEELADQISV